MLKKMFAPILLFLVALPLTAFGIVEQSFTQKNLTMHIKLSPDKPTAGERSILSSASTKADSRSPIMR